MESPDILVERSNFTKIQHLLYNASVILRKLFVERWKIATHLEWNTTSVEPFINRLGKKVFEKFGKIQKECILSGDVNRWDVTLLTDVLLQTKFNTAGDKTIERHERSMLEELKKIRNTLFHHHSLGIETELFESLWAKGEPILVYFGFPSGCLESLKNETNPEILLETNLKKNAIEKNQAEAKNLKEEANSCYLANGFQKSIELFSKAIVLPGLQENELSILYSNRSAAFMSNASTCKNSLQSEDIHSALQDAKQAIELNPTWYKGYFRAGNAYNALSKYEEALKCYDSALSLSPSRPELKQARDNCRMKRGEDSRREHLDPCRMPGSFENSEVTEFLKSAEGSAMSTLIDKFTEELSPGATFVQRGHMYIHGQDNNLDYKLAAQMFTKGAVLGNADGLYNLGQLHKEGKGVQQNFDLFLKFTKQAASQPHLIEGTSLPNVGVAEAEHSLGLAYWEGVGVDQDHAEAAKWFQRASDHGCSGGSNNLAFLYMNGQGVPLNIERGKQYWKLAASQGNVLAMLSLAVHYLEERDAIQAREWHRRAVKHGNLEAKLNSEEFESIIDQLERENKMDEETLMEAERKIGINLAGQNLNMRRKEVLKKIDPVVAQTMDRFSEIVTRRNIQARTPNCSRKHDFNPDMLQYYAEMGSQTASRMLTSMRYFIPVLNFLLNSDTHETSLNILHDLAECYRIEPLIVQLSPKFKKCLRELVSEALKINKGISELDLSARICYSHLEMDSMEHVLTFVDCSKRLYPKEVYFHRMHSCMCGFLQKNDLALHEIEKSLQDFPADCELLYYRAVHTRLAEKYSRDEIIQTYKKFLEVAPPDHRKVPESYYIIAFEYFCMCSPTTIEDLENKDGFDLSTLDMTFIPMLEKYYNLGIEAEKLQLPCFMPYESTPKEILETNAVLIQRTKAKLRMGNVELDSLPPTRIAQSAPNNMESSLPKPNFNKLTDPNRIQAIEVHRKHILERLKIISAQKGHLYTSSAPTNQQRAPAKLAGLKPILFQEMDTNEDKVFEGFVIEVVSIEDAAFGGLPSIRLALEDETGEVQRAFIYNFPENDPKIVQQKLGFGAKLSIMNPYMRRAADGMFGIRVDDCASLFFHSPKENEKKCRFCMLPNAARNCGKCKWANYCGEECQLMDWKLLKHKLICRPL